MLIGDFKVNGYGINIRSILPLPSEDLSGQTSSTNQTEGGIKPKNLAVTLNIQYANESWLTGLIAIAESEDSAGRRTIYPVTNRTAKAMNIRQVKFTNSVVVREDKRQKAWAVSFTLTEHRSVAEKRQAKRRDTRTVLTPSSASVTPSEQTDFEAVLKLINSSIAQ